MNCESLGEILSAYIDGELNWEEKMMIEMHLQECPACQTIVRDFRNTSKMFYETFGELHAPTAFEQLIAENILTLRQSIQAHRLSLLYLVSGVFGMLFIFSLGMSPVGHFMRASIRLSVAILHGSINLMSMIGNIWFAMISVLMIVIFGLSIAGIIRLLRKIRSEALS
jgi:predicted anti-sigma-YlaC factor YlaD